MKIWLLICLLSFYCEILHAQPIIVSSKCFGGSNAEYGRNIISTNDGSLVMCGSTTSNDGDVSGNHGIIGQLDLWLMKTNTDGIIQWQKCLGGTGAEQNGIVRQTIGGGLIIGGWTNSNDNHVAGNHGSLDFWVVKTDSGGNILGQSCFGGTGTEKFWDIIQTVNGRYVATGYTVGSNNGDVSGNHGLTDAWVVQFDENGQINWQKCLGGSGGEELTRVIQTIDGGYILVGNTSSNNGDVNGYHGGTAGSTDGWLVKLDSEGSLQWQKCIGGTSNDFLFTIEPTSDGGYLLAGQTDSNDGDVSGNHGGADGWVIKIDSSGNILWKKCLGGTSSEIFNTINLTNDGGYLLAGVTSSNDGNISGNHGGSDGWLVKLNHSGNIEWSYCIGGSMNDSFISMLTTAENQVFLSGQSASNNGDVAGNHGSLDFWITRLNNVSNLKRKEVNLNTNLIFPNPTTAELKLNLSDVQFECSYLIYDSQGILIKSGCINSKSLSISVDNLNPGLYNLVLSIPIKKTFTFSKI